MTGTGARREPRSGRRSPTNPPLLTALQTASGLCPRRSHLPEKPQEPALRSARNRWPGTSHPAEPDRGVCWVCGAHTHRRGPREDCRAEPPSLSFSILYQTFPAPRGGASACGHLRQGAPAHGGTCLLRPSPGCSPRALASGPAAPTLRGCSEPLSPGLGQVGS